MDYASIAAGAEAVGLVARGGFSVSEADGLPMLADGRPAATLILLGTVGGRGFDRFLVAPEASDGKPDPLDRWSARVIDALAADLGARALYPFGGPPWWPFQRWAARAEPVAPSPLGLLIHPDHGLWHSWRGALAFAETIDVPVRADRPSPCSGCIDRPCLHACPVGAYQPGGFDVAACARHLAVPAGRDCMEAGCRARRACPVRPAQEQSPEQIRFHMQAFRAVHPA
ncbi:ferredoxin [Methyloraptor flagellatus]|uniref:Ferredoxin n=1 Tax=Methyloraptor flagellatus TaxID=3162530 RepID=A0AAU7X704_9HYPH